MRKWSIYEVEGPVTTTRYLVVEHRSSLHVHIIARRNVYDTWHTIAYTVITDSYSKYTSLLARLGCSLVSSS